MHDYLREIYNDFCIKNNLPRGRADYHDDLLGGAYLSAQDYLNSKIGLTNNQIYWLKNFVRLWNILEDTWGIETMSFDKLVEEVK